MASSMNWMLKCWKISRSLVQVSLTHLCLTRNIFQEILPQMKLLRSIHLRCSVRKGALKNFVKFTAKHLCQSLFLITFEENLWVTVSDFYGSFILHFYFTLIKLYRWEIFQENHEYSIKLWDWRVRRLKTVSKSIIF